jgi:hypothetical protein
MRKSNTGQANSSMQFFFQQGVKNCGAQDEAGWAQPAAKDKKVLVQTVSEETN